MLTKMGKNRMRFTGSLRVVLPDWGHILTRPGGQDERTRLNHEANFKRSSSVRAPVKKAAHGCVSSHRSETLWSVLCKIWNLFIVYGKRAMTQTHALSWRKGKLSRCTHSSCHKRLSQTILTVECFHVRYSTGNIWSMSQRRTANF